MNGLSALVNYHNLGRGALIGTAAYVIGRQRCGFRQEEPVDARMMIVATVASLLVCVLMKDQQHILGAVAVGNLVTAFLSATDAVQLRAPRSFVEWRMGMNGKVVESACWRLVYAAAASVLLDIASNQDCFPFGDAGLIVLHASVTVGVATADYDVICSAITRAFA